MSRYYQPRFRARDTTEAAEAFDTVLRERMMPYWYDTVLDRVNGGYHFSDKYRTLQTTLRSVQYRLQGLRRGEFPAPAFMLHERHVVSQARMLWTFAHMYYLHYSDAQFDYYQAAAHGYDFLTHHMWDAQHGGVYWKVSPSGQVLDSRKMLFGQGYAIFAFIEFHRASGLAEPRERALGLFRLVQEKMRDYQNGGWTEHTSADFSALPLESAAHGSFIEKIGLKCSYTMMHWLEALTELHQATGDGEVQAALEEAIRITTTKFYTLDLADRHNFLTPAWQRVEAMDDEGFSPGHELEFAWLLLRAQRVLGVPLDWDQLEICLNYALRFAFDQQHGGFFHDISPRPFPVTGKKTWWVQAEGLCALTDALMHQANAEYHTAAMRHLSWIWNYQMLADGVWIWSTDARGKITTWVKADVWKEAYHETRALTKFIAAFIPARQTPTPAAMPSMGR